MDINKAEIMRIAKLADLKIKDNEVDEYAKNLEDILNFTKILDKVNIDDAEESIAVVNNQNVFRKDEVKTFENLESLLENAPDKENNMFKIPKVIQ